jgi:hypothetical protein
VMDRVLRDSLWLRPGKGSVVCRKPGFWKTPIFAGTRALYQCFPGTSVDFPRENGELRVPFAGKAWKPGFLWN